MSYTFLEGYVYQAIDEFSDHLERELGTWKHQWGPFYYVPGERKQVFWTRNIWKKPFIATFTSISEAAQLLRSIQRNWALTPFTQFRRAELINSKLPYISSKPKNFPFSIPDAPMGGWTLLDVNSLLASAECESPFPGGIIDFEENKYDPPSRAYLKLQEAFTRTGRLPGAGSRVLDAGACPGGWTWVLAEAGADIIAVDRSPLDERLMNRSNVRFIQHDAFTLKPEDIGPLDWFCSDVICYPPKLLDWIQRWLDSGLVKNFICTIKMQGDPDFESTRAFAEIPGSSVVHLHYNKHELCWIKTDN